MDIIDRLEDFRLEQQLTQERLAKQLKVDFTTLNRWLNRKSVPRKMQVYRIEKLIGSGARYAKNSK